MNDRESTSSQYSDCLDKLLWCFNDCARFDHGEVVVKVRATGRFKREVHIQYGRDYKFLFSLHEIAERAAASAAGALKEKEEYAQLSEQI